MEVSDNEKNRDTSSVNDQPVEYSPMFLKLRAQSIKQITGLMDETTERMTKLERSMERVNTSTPGVFSTARIWSSFYDPRVVEKLKQQENLGKDGKDKAEE